ncbi:MAG TPA: N-acetylglucosamine-6-phosphate deacetylase, partial [Anaerolineae bacterium]|nr:N-acetylglucosamine-6-phosphate deacetylase [Anaerolineae bacterium]
KGAFREESLQQPDVIGLMRYMELAQEQIRLITLAPELPRALDLIVAAREGDVVVAVGHSAATWNQMLEAIKAGLTHAAHTFNAMRGLHHREPGVVGAVLVQDCLTAEIIADGLHVHPAVIALLVRAKGPDRVVLVTDAIRAAGLSEGEYELEEHRVTVAQGAARLVDGTLAGSLLTMEQGVANLVEQVGLPLPEAVGMATLNPARVLGLTGCKGSLAPGRDADLVIMTEDYQVIMTMVKGKIVHMAG